MVRYASALGVAVLGLTACGSSAPKSGSATPGVRVIARSGFAGQSAASDVFPAVSGSFGEHPHVKAKAKDIPPSPSMLVLSYGTGDPVVPGSVLELRYVKTLWGSGRVLHDSWAAGIAHDTLPPSAAEMAIRRRLNDVPIGSRVELVNPSPNGITVYVIDLVSQAIDLVSQAAPSPSPS